MKWFWYDWFLFFIVFAVYSIESLKILVYLITRVIGWWLSVVNCNRFTLITCMYFEFMLKNTHNLVCAVSTQTAQIYRCVVFKNCCCFCFFFASRELNSIFGMNVFQSKLSFLVHCLDNFETLILTLDWIKFIFSKRHHHYNNIIRNLSITYSLKLVAIFFCIFLKDTQAKN